MMKTDIKEKILEAVISEIQIGVVVLGMNKQILYSNPFFEKTFSLSEKPAGKRLSDLINVPSFSKTLDSALSSDENQPREITIQGKGNQILEARLVPFSDMIIGFFHDVTEEKRVEAIKRDFVANVSHELRTPLASIKGYAETLLDGALDDKATLKNFLTIIDRHANRMTALIEDLLTLSMLESHQMPLSLKPLDIKGLISSIVQGFEKQAKDKGIELIINVNGKIPKVTGDKDRLEQVIVNLVDNAIKYTIKGTVKVSAAETADNMLRVDVEDTGIG